MPSLQEILFNPALSEKEIFAHLAKIYSGKNAGSSKKNPELAEKYAAAVSASENSKEYKVAIYLLAQECERVLQGIAELYDQILFDAETKSEGEETKEPDILKGRDPVEVNRAVAWFKKVRAEVPEADFHIANLYYGIDDDESKKYYELFLSRQKDISAKSIIAKLKLFLLATSKNDYLQAIAALDEAAEFLKTKIDLSSKDKDSIKALIIQIENNFTPINQAASEGQVTDRFTLNVIDELNEKLQLFAGVVGLRYRKPKKFAEVIAAKDEIPLQNQLQVQLLNAFVPILSKLGRDESILKQLKSEDEILKKGVCFALCFLWLASLRNDRLLKEKSHGNTNEIAQNAEIDNIAVFTRTMHLIEDTNFIGIYLKLNKGEALTKIEEATIAEVERFIQLLRFNHGALIISGMDETELFKFDPDRMQTPLDMMASYFESTNGDQIGYVTKMDLSDIVNSKNEFFILTINDIHVVAVIRDPDDSNQFLLFEPNGFEDGSENPKKVNFKQLSTALHGLEKFYNGTPQIQVQGFDFLSPEEKATFDIL
jgi:hypothetical protein